MDRGNIFKTYIAEKNNIIYVLDVDDLENIICADAINGVSVDAVEVGLMSDVYLAKAILLDLDSIDLDADNVISAPDWINANISGIDNEYINEINGIYDNITNCILWIAGREELEKH